MSNLENRPWFSHFHDGPPAKREHIHVDKEEYDKLKKWFEDFEEKMRIKYAELCETRIHDMKADAVASFIEDEIFGQEPSEILGVSPERGKA